ncbi:Serine/threonine-protein kinase rio2 [Porphyridium purpureum]|uniref:non-specific serine/threonine protein kinase n=1 Tax=Porphyridium purpureum TaxID=35688 RepID=A0A5J4Z3K7_PORPP|nr:Serine/threonine-protein kinase rio2 [Porphyridium purpureum]|eukprot:POR0854..scf295_1
MKFDVSVFRFLSDSDLRVLSAVEQGMRNHELVPTSLICSLSSSIKTGFMTSISNLHKYRLLHHDGTSHDAYRLTPLGYDVLALNALMKRGSVASVGRRIGVGKEAEVYEAVDAHDRLVALKFHRLGKTSFRNVKQTRDYLQNRNSTSWLYLSKLAAEREYTFMVALHARHFQIPEPFDTNRHGVVMQFYPGASTLSQLSSQTLTHGVEQCVELLRFALRLAQCGLVHCDLNEFNVLATFAPPPEDCDALDEADNSKTEGEDIEPDDFASVVIDFPQAVSTDHQLGPAFLQRDLACILRVFAVKFGIEPAVAVRLCLDEFGYKDVAAYYSEGRDSMAADRLAPTLPSLEAEDEHGDLSDIDDIQTGDADEDEKQESADRVEEGCEAPTSYFPFDLEETLPMALMVAICRQPRVELLDVELGASGCRKLTGAAKAAVTDGHVDALGLDGEEGSDVEDDADTSSKLGSRPGTQAGAAFDARDVAAKVRRSRSQQQRKNQSKSAYHGALRRGTQQKLREQCEGIL